MTVYKKPRYPVLDKTQKLGQTYGFLGFNEAGGTDIYDLSGNFHHGSLVNTTGIVRWGQKNLVPGTTAGGTPGASISGPELSLDGVNDRIDVDSLIVPALGSFSVSLWIVPSVTLTTSTANQRAIFWYGDDTSLNDVKIFLNPGSGTSDPSPGAAGTITLRLVDSLGTIYTITTSGSGEGANTWTANVPHLLTATYNVETGAVVLYVDGIAAGTSSMTVVRGTAALYCSLGGHTPTPLTDAAHAYPFPGIIDLVRIYDFPLTTGDVLTLFQDPLVAISPDTPIVVKPTAIGYDFKMTQSSIINAAYRKCAIDLNTSGNAGNLYAQGAEQLNMLLKDLDNYGFRPWQVDWIAYPMYVPPPSWVVGTDGSVYQCIRSHVASIDTRPIDGANWSTYWRSMGTVGQVWNEGEPYIATGDIQVDPSIIDIQKAVYRYNQNDVELEIISRVEYFVSIFDKTQQARPIFICFDKTFVPTIRLWPQPGASELGNVLHIQAIRKMANLDGVSDNPKVWERWYPTLVYGLANLLSDEIGLPLTERGWLRSRYAAALDAARGSDRETIGQDFMFPAF